MIERDELVRDRWPDILRAAGVKIKSHVADETEFFNYLSKKLNEKIEEVRHNKSAEKLADMREVLLAWVDAIADFYKIDKKEVRRIQSKKARNNGRFRRKIILDES